MKLPISSCWVVCEGLTGLQNQAVGIAKALGVSYALKEARKPRGFWQRFFPSRQDLTPPWPDLLISCGRQGVTLSVAIRKASQNRTFTVHIQDPLVNPKYFDVVVVPEHDKVRGKNVLVTQGAVHHVTQEKLEAGADRFRPLFASLPRPLISVLIGGKNRHQDFNDGLARDLGDKLVSAAQRSGGSLAVSFSRRTGAPHEAVIRGRLGQVPAYIWDNKGENPYLGLLSLADVIVVTNDSISMLSEACSTGKPVYIYEMPRAGGRHKHFYQGLIKSKHARLFDGTIEIWNNTALDETRRAADFIAERFMAKQEGMHANTNARNRP